MLLERNQHGVCYQACYRHRCCWSAFSAELQMPCTKCLWPYSRLDRSDRSFSKPEMTVFHNHSFRRSISPFFGMMFSPVYLCEPSRRRPGPNPALLCSIAFQSNHVGREIPPRSSADGHSTPNFYQIAESTCGPCTTASNKDLIISGNTIPYPVLAA